MTRYRVNVNLPNRKAVIHLADSPYGNCQVRVKSVAGGGWYGPFDTLAAAESEGPRNDVPVLYCGMCLKDRNT